MATRTEREKNKRQHDKHLSVLMELLREEQNKYCADCRAKGPRWASWNIGIFVCITCAGIHRNLGVHISKVKSVNLDAWTQEQITNMQEWGNRRAAQYYEYHLPSNFKRPHGDSYHSLLGSLEQFIRSKYEKKLYICKEGPPPPSEVKQEKTKEKKKSTESSKKTQQISRPEVSKPVKNNVIVKETKMTVKTESSETGDLLSLSTAPQNDTLLSIAKQSENTADLLNFGPSFSSIINNPASAPPPTQPAPPTSQGFAFDLVQTMSSAPVTNAAPPLSNGLSTGQTSLEEDLFKDDLTSGNQSTKDSIMALYQPSQQQTNQQMFGVPGGVYLQQQQQKQTQPNAAVLNQGKPAAMAPQYNPQLVQQQQQMYQLNQVQQQMAKLGFTQPPKMTTNQAVQNGQVMPNNRAVPNSQVMAGYNYNQAAQGMTPPYYRGPTPYATTPPGTAGPNWMPQLKTGTFPPPHHQQQPPYLTTGPTVPGFTMYQAQGGMPSGHTLSTNLWK